jgi:protein-S-isoprenylcysteine O-methyltransferase Ste14
MKAIGRETIHPLLFYSGKASGYLAWILLLLSICRIVSIGSTPLQWLQYASYVLLALGVGTTTMSLINLGSSTRLGLPDEPTSFRHKGLYRISRNPMYVGFNMVTASSMIFHWNVVVALLGLYSIVTYHMIILGEERFLEGRFGKEYQDYKRRVRRYL